MAARDIAGRHAPTRQSLRHSRMIVMSRGGKGRKYQIYLRVLIIYYHTIIYLSQYAVSFLTNSKCVYVPMVYADN